MPDVEEGPFMLKTSQIKIAAMFAVASLGVTAFAEEAKPVEPAPSAPVASEAKPTKEEAAAKLAEKQAEAEKLKEEAKRVTEEMGKLASGGQLPTSEEGITLMRQMLDELEEINRKLEALTMDVEDLKGWVEGQSEALPVIASTVDNMNRFRPTLYTQFQLRSSNRQGGSAASDPSFFGTPFSGNRENTTSLRRARFGFQYTIDSKTSLRTSFDGGTGGNNQGFELRDLQLIYLIDNPEVRVGTELYVGRQALPLGYELERSSGDREFAERANYNRVLFNGERTYSAYIRQGLTQNVNVILGVGNSLTSADPENTAQNLNKERAIFGGIRYETPTMSLGLTRFEGKRNTFKTPNTVTTAGQTNSVFAPQVNRKFTYLDATLVGLVKGVTLRGELMLGEDRLPISATQTGSTVASAGQPITTRAKGTKMSGYHLQAAYNIDWRNIAFARIESFDPNIDTPNNLSNGVGFGYRYFINPGASFTATFEQFRVSQFTARRTHKVMTLRYQFRF